MPIELSPSVQAAPAEFGPRRRIAVIGAGVAGLTAAHVLQRAHDVTLFERNGYFGGHTHTVTIESGPDAGLAVDTGFIVYNDRNYPTFRRLLAQLGVASQPSDMSFSFHCEGSGFQYAGNGVRGLFAQRRNLVRPAFARMLLDIARFNRRARADLATGALAGVTLGDYVDGLSLSRGFADWYLYPMAAAIWSTPAAQVRQFPAMTFVRFFDQHGLLALAGAPPWRTVTGGSRTYVDRLMAGFKGTAHRGAGVRAVTRQADGAEVRLDRECVRFDAVVVATHADEALALLADPTPEERRELGAWRYSVNRAVLHTDAASLPPRRAAWSSWNYVRESGTGNSGESPVSMTYWMNRLQRLPSTRPYCVSLNRARPIEDRHVIRELTYTHPCFTPASLASQRALPSLQGTRNTWFCGSYFGYGFHEDAVRSACDVARGFGLEL